MAKYMKGVPSWYNGNTEDLPYQNQLDDIDLKKNEYQKELLRRIQNKEFQTKVGTPNHLYDFSPANQELINRPIEKAEPIQPVTTQPQKKTGLLSTLLAPFSKENLKDVDTNLLGALQPKLKNWVSQKGGSATVGAVNSIGLGLPKVLTEKLTGNKETAYSFAKEENPISYTAGEIGGYLAPGIGATKALKPVTSALTKNISSKIGKQVLEGAIVGGALDTTQGVIEGDNAKQLATRVGTGALLGAGADIGLNKLGELVPKIARNFNTNIAPTVKDNVLTREIPSINQFTPTIKSQESVNADLDINTLPNKNNVIKAEELALDKEGFELPRPDQKIVSSGKDKTNFKEKLDKFYTRIVDSQAPLKSVGDKTYTLATNSKNVGGTVDYILKDGLVDRNGKKIGESLKTLVEDVPKKDYNDFWEYALQRTNVGRAAQEKNVFPGFDSERSKLAVSQWESKHPEWKGKADNFVKWIDSFMKEWGVNSGVTDADLYKSLREMYPDYLPTNRQFDDIEEFVPPSVSSKGYVNQKTPLKKATGSDRDIIDPVENIMNLVNRTVRTAKYNEVGQSLLKEIKKNPVGMMEIANVVEGEVNPNLKNIVTVLEDGKPVNLQINNKSVLESLEGLYKNTGDDVDKAAKKVTNLFKSLITQKNPVFAVRNVARDIPTAYINGSEGNPLKFGVDLLSAGKDLIKNSPIAQQYKALGGGGSNFFNSDNVAKSAKELTSKNPLKKIGGAIESFNNLTESAPRLAEFKRTVKSTGDLQKGLYAANDVTTNFSRGGDITKKVDSYVPYLNAGIQGLDKLARQFKDKPISTVLKGATAVTAPTMILNHINKDNQNYKDLDNRTKDNYYLIPNGDTFIKIPKSREFGVIFGSLTERTLRQLSGEKTAFKDFSNTAATNFSPANPIEDNILSPLYNLKSNKDFANRDIVPRAMIEDKRSPYLQYDEKTTEPAKAIAEAAKKANIDLSPKQIDYIVKSYTGVIAQLAQPALTKSTMQGGNKTQKILKPITTQFVADPLYSNQNLSDFYDNLDMLKSKATDKNLVGKIDSKVVTDEESEYNKFNKYAKEISDLNKQIKLAENSNQAEEVKKLRAKMLETAKQANKSVK
jgi:hypothetical protein